jgi:hypothetical protein
MRAFWLKSLKGTDLGASGRIILKWILSEQSGKVWDWIHLAQNRKW